MILHTYYGATSHSLFISSYISIEFVFCPRNNSTGSLNGRKERNVLFNNIPNTFYLWLYGIRHMVKNHSDSEKGNCHMGYSFWLAARVLLYAPSHRQYYTSHGALGGTRNSSMGGSVNEICDQAHIVWTLTPPSNTKLNVYKTEFRGHLKSWQSLKLQVSLNPTNPQRPGRWLNYVAIV